MFLLNRYFTEEDIPMLKQYLSGLQHERKVIKSRTLIEKKQVKVQDFDTPVYTRKEGELTGQKYEQRSRIRSQAAEKMKEIEKKYSRVLSFIKNKQNLSIQQKKPGEKQE